MAPSMDRGRRYAGLLLSLFLAVGMVGVSAPAAWAADPTASMSIQKSANVATVTPGETFTYTVQVQCTTGTVAGCVNAQFSDELPPYISLNGTPTVSGSTTNPNVDEGPPVTVTFNDDLGGGEIGLAPGNVIVITIPVTVDDDIPVSASGIPVTNTGTISAGNADTKSDDATVTPDVPSTLNAVTTKEIDPEGATAVPGTPLSAALTGQNTSNVPVDTLVIQDPVDPAATPSPFEYLAITAPLPDVTMPAGADTVQVSLYVNGAWVDGPAGPPQPALPAGVDPADATGIRWTFTSTDGADIPVGATADVGINMVQRDNVTTLTAPITITNDANTTVSAGGDSATSPPASDDYKIPPSAIDVVAGKTFDPDTVHAGDPSTVTLSGANNSDGPLNTMTITEPAPGTTNPMADGGLTFDGIGSDAAGDGIVWPTGATEASVTYTGPGCAGTPQTTDTVNTLPAPPAGCTVTGFTVTFTGEIAAGATATIPFVVTTAAAQAQEELTRDNTVQVDGANDVTTATGQATDSITSIVDRLDVITGKTIVPSTIPAWPGEIVTAELTGQVAPFPASTVPATQIIVQDPATIPDPNQWYDSFDPAGVVATPVPACSTGAVEYTVDGTNWLPVPGMQDVPPGIYNAPFPEDVADTAIGIRFVYTADPAGNGCSGGFPPGTTVAPNISYSLEDVPTDTQATFTDCAASSASTPTTSATSDPACDSIDVTPVSPGDIHPIGKAWDVDLLNARSQEQAGATISWSTAGFTGIDRAQITDTQNPDTTALPDSVFDEFDLVRVDPITATMDPLLTYDQVQSFQLYELPVGSTDPAAGSWVAPTGSPCPAACDGTFPGYMLTADERAVTIGFRLNYIESPTRGSRLSAGSPPVGSGVAASTGNNRQIHPVFQMRDELRSDPDVPITAGRVYNVAGQPGIIDNTVRADPFRDRSDTTPISTFTADDTIALVDIPVTAQATKTWDGGPLGIPDPGVPQNQWPTARVTVTGANTTTAKIDTLTIQDPTAGTNPFDAFNLSDFVGISDPGEIGASDVTITLDRSGAETPYTQEAALALTEADLVDVTGFTVEYTGRIDAATAATKPTATIVFDTRLRTQSRSTSQPPQPGDSITNATTTTASDLVDYPGVVPKSQTANAADDIDLVGQGIAVDAGKSFDPSTLTEPATGPVTAILSGQPTAPGGGPIPPSRAVKLVLTDSSTTFWNTYDLLTLNPITFTAPINQVQVDAYTGGTWSVVAGEPVLAGGSWQLGTPTTDPNVTLPAGVTAGQVQGLRYTFTRSDGANWENPADPLQRATFQVQRRDELHTGGPVLPDLAQNPPAPGESAPGVTTDTVTADVTSSDVDVNGNPLTATDDADATIVYHHATNAVTVTKVGNTQAGTPVSPGADFPYTLTVTNSGDVDIVDPVITDRLPADATPQVVLADDPKFTYAISGAGLPTDPSEVTVTATPSLSDAASLQWTFPAGSTLEPGAIYTITFYVKTRPGLDAGTELTNEFGVTGDRPWDQCANGGSNTVDPTTGECATDTTNTVLAAGAISVNKQVKAQGSDALGVVPDPLAVMAPTCVANADGFYRRPCIPIAQPGGDITWRWEFVNTGNRPLDRILGIDRLPAPGDTASIAPILPRGSQWQPLLTGERPELATVGAGTFNIYYTTGSAWCDQPQPADGQLLCPALNWVEWPEGQTLPDLGVDPATVTGLQTELLPTTPLAPAGTIDVDVAMTAPAYSPADTPNTTGPSGDPTFAFNSVGSAGHWVTGDDSGYTLSTEPPRVGVGLAHGSIQVEKLTSGDAADDYAPESFQVTLSCTSDGVDVPLPDDVATQTLTAGTPVTVYDLPVYAVCTLAEGDNGQSSSTAVPVTVPPDGTADVPIATLTNTYEFASLSVTKAVDSDAVDQDGQPIPYGPFTVTVDCTYLDEPVYADGYGPDNPMTSELSDDETVTFSGLPSGADCTITETDTKGAVVTTITTRAGDGDPTTTDGTTAPIELATGDTNTATVTNEFTVGTLHLEKQVTGSLAPAYGAGPFALGVTCVLDDESGSRTVYDDTVVLGGAGPLTADISNLPTGAECTVTETDDGKASTVTITPAQPVVIGTAPDVVGVTVVNSFEPAKVLVNKVVTGDAADYAPDSFEVTVTCSVDGDVLSGFPVTVTVVPGTPTEIETLAGSTCSAVETDTGEATEVTYEPPNPDDPDSSAEVNTGPVQPAVITITNEYRAGDLQIAKAIDGPGAALATRPFVFDVTCAFNGDPAAFETTVTLTPAAGATSLTSDVIGPLPVGAVCTVTETDSGGADVTPPPVTVTIPDVDSDGVAQVVVAGFVNPFSAAQLQVTKVLAGADATAHAADVFTLAVTCQYDLDGSIVTVYSGSVAVSGGQTVVVSGADGNPVLLPPGAHCFASETDSGGANSSSVDFDSYDNAVIVEQGDELGTVTITAVNTFDTPPGPPAPPVHPPTPPVYPPLPYTGFPLGQWVLLGFALLAAGAIAVSVTRRRRAG